ncbi:MAG: peptidase domain-containing ABC transporter [Acetobacteraceae bacterium]|nr:peptidase domain-containing ABC transporter [Acetobacteraceae bacterium]
MSALALTPQLSALRCVFLVAAHHGVHLAPDELPLLTEGDMLSSVLSGLDRAGFRARALHHASWRKASALGSAYPALVTLRDGGWAILIHCVPDASGQPCAALLDPRREGEGVRLVPRDAFLAAWSGTLVLCRRAPPLLDEARGFGLGWFLAEAARQRGPLAGVAAMALLANLVAFGIPLLFQALIDKVVPHQAWNTLAVVVAVFVLLALFEAAFGYTRQRLMLLAGARMDARLASRSFAHLLALPLSFFETRPAGVTARHLQQTERVRQFLTGRLLHTALDAAMLPLLLLLLALYSGVLTLVVLGFAAVIALVIGALVPVFRARLAALYEAEAARQAHLVETLHNMRAVKSLVLEPARQRAWDGRVAAAARRHLALGGTGALAGALTQLAEKLMQVTVLGLGAALVFDGRLSLGALVAFTMLAGRVTGPLVQIVTLLHEAQEAALSLRMLGEVMHHPPERAGGGRPARPPILGAVEFREVGFTYPGAASPALDRVSFKAREGEVIGIVGRSGSGKTTLTRLIQGIQAPQSGLVLLDGTDIRHIDLPHLRRGVGVVLQENLLFRGSLRDNIAAARPDAPLEEVQAAARLAGAEEFIRRLPLSYETLVEEGGANLSGGQRQRVAIARALLTAPRLLVFDEATSALDPESEAVIQQNLTEIARGRTLLIVSHRLSSLVRADNILVLEEGRVADFAPHAVLLQRCEAYRQLWHQQTQHLR